MGSESTKNTFRLTPAEQRILLVFGDLLMGFISLIGGIYFWAMQDPEINFSLDLTQKEKILTETFLVLQIYVHVFLKEILIIRQR